MVLLNKFFGRYIMAIIATTGLLTSHTSFADPLTADMGYMTIPQGLQLVKDVSPIRLSAIKQASTSLGARGGLAWESRNIDIMLSHQSIFLDQTFDFNQLLLAHNVIPPVLTESNNNLNLDSDSTLRIAEKTYRILEPAHFVTVAPNWRDYLEMRFKKPGPPDQTLLPKSEAETALWNYYLKQGWEEGVKQADAVFTVNLNRLKRDYKGMVLYRELLTEHMVSAPFVSKAELGVTGNADELRINDQVLRIVAHSKLQPNAKQWRPVLTK